MAGRVTQHVVGHNVYGFDLNGPTVSAGIRDIKELRVASNSKLPFVGRIFWKVFAAVIVLLVSGWILIPRLFGYAIESQDYGGSSICAPILAYLIHLWILPGPDSETEDEQEPAC